MDNNILKLLAATFAVAVLVAIWAVGMAYVLCSDAADLETPDE